VTVLENLVSARAKIAKPEDWTQDALARNALGHGLYSSHDHAAVCWCALGAIRAAGGKHSLEVFAAVNHFARVNDIIDIPAWNDSVTHEEVLAAFDRAIEAERQKEQIAA